MPNKGNVIKIIFLSGTGFIDYLFYQKKFCFIFEVAMAASKMRALLLDISDRLIELYTRREEAADSQDWARSREIQEEITRVIRQRNSILAEDGRKE